MNKLFLNRSVDFNNFIEHIDEPLTKYLKKDIPHSIRYITMQLTEACNLYCTYCYQINKSLNKMSFETAKKFIDLILSDNPEINNHINGKNSGIIVLDFIGGEPLLEIDLMDKIVDYFIRRMIELDHPWLMMYRISVGTNGTLYFDERFQKFIRKHKTRLSVNITVDGNKELHDSCRVFENGSGSYDKAMAAVKHWIKFSGNTMPSTKITIAPENVKYISNAIIHMIENGFTVINENCVYEEGWTVEHARILYKELKKIADYLIDNNMYEDHSIRIFNQEWYKPMSPENNNNWCGGDGSMLAVDVHGNLFNCIRYMKSSVGNDVKPLIIGNVDDGIATTKSCKDNLKCMQCITRRSQSTDECFNCPIATGCGWCTAYNYQKFGTCDKRATYICIMHKAASLATAYYWNSVYRKLGDTERFKINCKKDWALDIIDEDEYNLLLNLSNPV